MYARVNDELATEHLPKIPKGWGVDKEETHSFIAHRKGLTVAAHVGLYGQGSLWLHLALTRRSSVPTLLDADMVRKTFAQRGKAPIISMPPAGKVYSNKYTLHMYVPVGDNEVLPNFSEEMANAG